MNMIASISGITLLLFAYLLFSFTLFPYVYESTKTVIDEYFHLPQGLAYCYGEFNRWDPKITTLPGLYLFSALLCGQMGSCSVSCMRKTSILASGINLVLFYCIRCMLFPKESIYKKLFNATNLALLPPLFFFSQLYYTDVVSLTTVLGLFYFGCRGNYFIGSIFGFLAIITRQTNIIYVVFMMALRGTGLIYNNIYNLERYKRNEIQITQKDVTIFFRKWQHQLQIFFNGIKQIHLLVPMEILTYNLLLLFFLVFTLFNGGIVVGDKEAHPATLHLTQIFYFSLFSLFFGWPHFLKLVIPFTLSFYKNILLYTIAIFIIAVIIQFNTIIHPYLLADNRHYIFYVYKSFFQSRILRLIWAPVYLFCLYCIFNKIYNQNDIRIGFLFPPIILLGLCFQGLIDVRYFLAPYSLMRLLFRDVSFKILILEFVFFVLINYKTLHIFFNKEIIWEDFKDLQRLIW